MTRGTRVIISVLMGVALAALIAYVQTPRGLPPGSVAGSQIGDRFEGLVDHNGVAVTPETFADKHQLVFFGFTHCPAVCPTELHRLTQVLKTLSPEQKLKLATIFVSVDPARDTPGVMKDYLAMFDPSITGLTGSEDALKAVTSHWKVYAAKVKLEGGGDYTVDHSTFLYLRGPDGRLVDLFAATDTPAAISGAIKQALP